MRGAVVGLCVLATAGAGCARPRATIPVAPAPGYQEIGRASWYGVPHHGRRTASGEIYDMHQMTAAHRTLPFGTWLLVEHLETGRGAEVRVNDRGPFVRGRILDLSYAAARTLDAVGPGVIPVRLRVIARESSSGADGAGRPFAVQVGAFTDEERARSLEDEVRRGGWDARVETGPGSDRVLYRVRVGHFTGREAAVATARELAARGYPALVIAD